MIEKTVLIINMLSDGFTIDEVEQTLQLSPQELNSILKSIRDMGYDYQKTYSSDGVITIKKSRSLRLNPNYNIKINVKDNTFRTLFISDVHMGGPYEKPERIGMITNYAESHDIHSIFNTGDLINDYYPDQEPEIQISDPLLQADRYLRFTPYKSKIIHYNLGGNHDYKSLVEKGFDSLRFYEDRRYDLVNLGYGLCYVRLKDDTIALAHELKSSNNNIKSTLIFRGHSHKYKNRDNKIIYVPAVTDNYQGPYEYIPIPGFLDVEFTFFDNKITKFNLRHLSFHGADLNLAHEETMIIRPDYEERLQKKLLKEKRR